MLRLWSLSCSGILLSVVLTFSPVSKNEIPSPAKSILENANRLELLSLDPHHRSEDSAGYFYGYPVLRTVVVTSPDTRKALVSAFERAVEASDGRVAACFNPRHGLRASKGTNHEDFVICFECAQVVARGDVQGRFLISDSAVTVFDSVLRESRQKDQK
jgi:hypothetical protein